MVFSRTYRAARRAAGRRRALAVLLRAVRAAERVDAAILFFLLFWLIMYVSE